MNVKKFRDSVYGYVEIPEKLVHDIIDTDVFQRLRNIRQTSYAPLYPASLHNRFVHSIGVYHLGRIAFESVYQSILYYKDTPDNIMNTLNDILTYTEWQNYRKLFELACLLHDVGHSPFSHTGEEFFETSKSDCIIKIDEELYKKRKKNAAASAEKTEIKKELQEAKRYNYRKHLAQLTGDHIFLSSVAKDIAAEHELMSCIVSLEKFGDSEYFQSAEDKVFFARCITGLLYQDINKLDSDKYYKMDVDKHNEIKKELLLDCFIQLLHSSVIDVDRLDYIIRDANTMGYQSVSIDYERLLKGIVIIKKGDYNFTVGFHKNAISIIENAIYAHDCEKKWIQGHPTILYDSFLIQRAIMYIEDRIRRDYPNARSTLFSYDSLTEKGSMFGKIQIRYLADEDVLYLMKNVYSSVYSSEYFNRMNRRLPVWKSEAEFKNLFKSNERKIMNKAMQIIMMGSDNNKAFLEITPDSIVAIEQDIKEAEESKMEIMVSVQQQKKKHFIALLDVCSEFGLKPNVVLISTKFFKSNFSKGEVQKIPIFFPHGDNKECLLQDVSSTLSSASPIDEKFIYMYYYPKTGRKKVDANDFAHSLIDAFKEHQQ